MASPTGRARPIRRWRSGQNAAAARLEQRKRRKHWFAHRRPRRLEAQVGYRPGRCRAPAAAGLEFDGRGSGYFDFAAHILTRESIALAIRPGDEAEALGLVIAKNFAAHVPIPERPAQTVQSSGGSQGRA
ncbi:hypothetical protein LB533_02395 [Mesorhizobium sp. BR1-1-13]|uniref:hypothetical protein n=1 Tax=Mesorhizobium sp. BR1-1-13 TaxID=2876656 RepID=UPI001CD09E66|nr:hypothetical protein [Mesorhizobium sp. BR1-1-13]MBZ9939951.1 hypothetical protein [Mesorhizobium sp. BR1-1-13]